MDAAREEIAAFKGLTSGRLVLGAMQALAGLDLPRLLAAFHAAHPGIDVSLREDSTRDMFTLAARGEIDLAIAALDVERPPGLDAVPLVREPVLMALPAAHPLASHEAVALRLLRARHVHPLQGRHRAADRLRSRGQAGRVRPAHGLSDQQSRPPARPCQRGTRGGVRARLRRQQPATARACGAPGVARRRPDRRRGVARGPPAHAGGQRVPRAAARARTAAGRRIVSPLPASHRPGAQAVECGLEDRF